MANRTSAERMALEDAISFRNVTDFKELKVRLNNRYEENRTRIADLAFSSQAQDAIDRYKLLGEQDVLLALISQL